LIVRATSTRDDTPNSEEALKLLGSWVATVEPADLARAPDGS
jgi:hypothetical protein